MSAVTRHTPSPWRIDRDLTDNGAPVIVAHSPWLCRDRIIAKVWFDGGSEDPEVQANAALIIAGPTMLAALLRVQAWFRNQPGSRLEDLPSDFIDEAIQQASRS